MRHVAELSGVSPTAVSQALRNHPSISEATRKKIKAIAERINYRPEVVLSLHLKVQQWLLNLGLRIPDDVGFVDLDCADRGGTRAGVYQHHERVGALALDTLMLLRQRNERGIPEVPQLTLLEGAWVEGATIKKQRGPARR